MVLSFTERCIAAENCACGNDIRMLVTSGNPVPSPAHYHKLGASGHLRSYAEASEVDIHGHRPLCEVGILDVKEKAPVTKDRSVFIVR